MPIHATHPSVTRKTSQAVLWRSYFSWRWNVPHPAPKKDKVWFITAAAAFKKLRLEHAVPDPEIRDLIAWYFTWRQFEQGALPRYGDHPAILRASNDKGELFILDQFKAWKEQHAYMLNNGMTIPQIAIQFRCGAHLSHFPRPWEIE